MDLYPSQLDFENGTNQLHDFNPGVHPFPSGLFWTIQLQPSSVQVDPAAGTASFHVTNLVLGDYGTSDNATSGPYAKNNPAIVTFDIEFGGKGNRVQISDPTLRFALDAIETSATMAWTVTTKGATFVSGPANTSTSLSAKIGLERNGAFFS